MKCENILFDFAVCSGGHFSNINAFCKTVTQQYNLRTYSDIVTLLTSSFPNPTQNITSKHALKVLVDADLSHFSVDDYNCCHLENCNFLYTHTKRIVEYYQSIGLDISEKEINIYLCDVFPRPFHNNRGLALAPDAYDEAKYGIKKGVYFLKNNISNYQSRLLLAHEIIHHICSKHHPELLARGLEEGLCELIGSYITNSVLFNRTIAANYIKFRRLKYDNPNQRFRLYTDYLRMAYLLLKKVGIEGVVYILNSGRKVIKEVESDLLRQNDIILPTPISTSFPNELMNELDQLLLGTIQNEVLSPLPCYIINNYCGERSISSFMKTHNIDPVDGKQAFDEIQNRIYGCVIDGDNIEFSDIEQLKKNGNILYECPTEP